MTSAPRAPDAVFLDRDGTINRKAPEGQYVTSWEQFEFLPGAREAIRDLSRAGIRVIVVTNQRGIARGHMTEADLADIHRRMVAELGQAGAHIDAIYHCPHEDGCDCRKPGTGMFLRAGAELRGIEFDRALVIGDGQVDVSAARAIGAYAVRLGEPLRPEPADARFDSLRAAVDWLLAGCA